MIYRRCSCRDERGKPYGTLPENATEQQIARACPQLLSDPKHGKWGYYLSRGFDAKGKRLQTRVANFSSKRAAQSAYAKAKAEHDRGEFVETSRTRFAQWCDEWLTSREQRGDIKASTLDAYRRYVDNDITPSPLGRLRLTDIKRGDVRRFIDGLIADGRGAATVRKVLATVQSALSAALRDDLIATNPARGVRLPSTEAHEFEPWTPAQVGAFLDHAATHRLGAIFEVAVWTGLRRAELLGLRWADVDLARRVLSVRTTRVQAGRKIVENSPKTNAGRRIVQLDDAAVGALVAWQFTQQGDRDRLGDLWEGDGHVFTYEDGRPIRPDYVTRLFESLRDEVNDSITTANVERAEHGEQPQPLLPQITLHGLRHMHASLLLAGGADIALVSKRLGHASISITADVYSHLVGDAARRAAESASALVPRAGAQQVHNNDGQIASSDAVGAGTSA
jgi:integrase